MTVEPTDLHEVADLDPADMGDWLAGTNVLGADLGGGFDTKSLIAALAEGINQGVDAVVANDKKKNVEKEAQAQANAIVALDVAVVEAGVSLAIAQRANKDKPDAPSVIAKAAALATAVAEQDRVASTLTPGATALRLAAVNKLVKDASTAWSNDSKSFVKQARFQCAQALAGKISGLAAVAPVPGNSQAVTPVTPPASTPEAAGTVADFFTAKHAGIPTWGWLTGGTLVATGLGFGLRSWLRARAARAAMY